MAKSKVNALVAQSGGPTCVINSSVCGVIAEAKKSKKIGKILAAYRGILGVLKEEIFDISKEKSSAIEQLKKTPSAALASCRYKLKSQNGAQSDFQRVIDVFKAHEIHYFFYAGGNDSMDTADKINKLAAQEGYELVCIGIPKTIDNDLAFTDHCPGYGSAAKYVATSAMEAGRDNESLSTYEQCTIIEVMGRNAGWIAAASGLAAREPQDAPHLIYMPEAKFTFEKLIADVKEVYKEFGRVFIVAGEGLKDQNGNFIAAETQGLGKDAFGNATFSGAAEVFKNIIQKELGIKVFCNKLGSQQRCSMHFASLTDVNEAFMCGKAAVKAAMAGVNGKMITLVREKDAGYKCGTGLADLKDVANGEKKVPGEFINEKGNHITNACRRYISPLIKGEAPVTIGKDGLPVYVRLAKKWEDKKLARYI